MRYLRTLHIVWSLVTRRLTRFQTMYNVLKFSEKLWNNVKKSIYRNRNATANFVNLMRTSTVMMKHIYCTFALVCHILFGDNFLVLPTSGWNLHDVWLNLNVCMCVCMYVGMNVCVCVHVYTCVCIYIHVYACICMPYDNHV